MLESYPEFKEKFEKTGKMPLITRRFFRSEGYSDLETIYLQTNFYPIELEVVTSLRRQNMYDNWMLS